MCRICLRGISQKTIALILLVFSNGCTIEDRATPDFQAVRNILLLHRAQDRFLANFGRYGTLRDLGPDGARFIEHELASGASEGYKITMTLNKQGYVIQARPMRWGESGRRSFYSDQSRVIHQVWTNEAANATSEELK